jgi:hypothetical protein
MPLQRSIPVLAAIILGLSPVRAGTLAQGARHAKPAEVTIKVNVLCNRATDTKDWYWDPADGDHR